MDKCQITVTASPCRKLSSPLSCQPATISGSKRGLDRAGLPIDWPVAKSRDSGKGSLRLANPSSLAPNRTKRGDFQPQTTMMNGLGAETPGRRATALVPPAAPDASPCSPCSPQPTWRTSSSPQPSRWGRLISLSHPLPHMAPCCFPPSWSFDVRVWKQTSNCVPSNARQSKPITP